jgi:hypothetical protein
VGDARNPKALIFRQDLQDILDLFFYHFPDESYKESALSEGNYSLTGRRLKAVKKIKSILSILSKDFLVLCLRINNKR